MTQPFTNLNELPARWPFQPVALSLGELCGEPYVRAACANHAALTGEDPAAVTEAAFKRVEFFPPAFERRLLHLLPRVGQKVGTRLAETPAGATTREFEAHTKVEMAPLSTLGYFRIGEDGRLYLIAKSEHYHAPLGHSFPGLSAAGPGAPARHPQRHAQQHPRLHHPPARRGTDLQRERPPAGGRWRAQGCPGFHRRPRSSTGS